ncbi:hypothetical protein RY831_23930 [Noviherbaspirillum sp. CPCC 100848]|uniref:Transmembrane protein n=1 Tax=Noviherbaspirillum album TaxID=3080276 RepID=A0ABU6JG92_9BURK|nr:hypothetical protein [Noviherbaspirillum sp. CPCC 100848]MEC4722217.1 hypothetical protein [Noviherbaspirillum sp. CPCC 100848]
MGLVRQSIIARLTALIQCFWRMAVPFWLFRNAAYGTPEQRAANYRYNRSCRHRLPFYILKWIGISVCMMQIMHLLSALMAMTVADSWAHLFATITCMVAGVGFAFACAMLSLLVGSYLYLICVKR